MPSRPRTQSPSAKFADTFASGKSCWMASAGRSGGCWAPTWLAARRAPANDLMMPMVLVVSWASDGQDQYFVWFGIEGSSGQARRVPQLRAVVRPDVSANDVRQTLQKRKPRKSNLLQPRTRRRRSGRRPRPARPCCFCAGSPTSNNARIQSCHPVASPRSSIRVIDVGPANRDPWRHKRSRHARMQTCLQRGGSRCWW